MAKKRAATPRPKNHGELLTIPAAKTMMREVLPKVYGILGPAVTQQYLQRIASLTLADERVCVHDVVNDHQAMLCRPQDRMIIEAATPVLSHIVQAFQNNRAIFPRQSELHFMYSGMSATDCDSHAEYQAFCSNITKAFYDTACHIINVECRAITLS